MVQTYRPRLSLSARRELFHFGKWLIVNNMLNFTSNRCADVLGREEAGARQLGLFNLSYEIATLPSSDVITPINRAIYPGYAIKAADTETLRRSYLQIIGLIALITLPAGVGIAAVANLLVPVVLGPAWIDAAPCVAMLAIYGVLLAIKSNNHYVYLAMGRPWIATILGVASDRAAAPADRARGPQGRRRRRRARVRDRSAGLHPHQPRHPVPGVAAARGAAHARALPSGPRGDRHVSGCSLRRARANVNPADGAALIVPLLFCVAIGAVLYVTVLYALWSLASKPDGPERRTLDVLQAKLWPRLAGPTASSALGRESKS